jgi:hypothetical protein
MSGDTGTKYDVIRLTRHLLNKAASNRTISKQESMVLVAGLDLCTCSESIESVSISGQYNLESGSNKTMMKQYELRDPCYHDLSFDKFFEIMKQQRFRNIVIIPHYVGGSSHPVYPVSEGYARAMLLIHKPWHGRQKPFVADESIIDQFIAFLGEVECPSSVKIPYERMKQRFLDKSSLNEAVASDMATSSTDGIDGDVIDLLNIIATFNAPEMNDLLSKYKFERGQDFAWDCPSFPVSKNVLN